MMTHYRKTMEKSYSREELIAYLKRRASVYGHTPTVSEINKDKDGPGMKNIRKEFDSYEAAIEAAGLEPLPIRWSDRTNEELLEAAREWSSKHGGAKISYFILENSRRELPNLTIVKKRFGGIKEYFELAGVPYEYASNNWSK